jgi:hypothetical protein
MPFCGWIEFAAVLMSLAEDAQREESNPSEKEHPDE